MALPNGSSSRRRTLPAVNDAFGRRQFLDAPWHQQEEPSPQKSNRHARGAPKMPARLMHEPQLNAKAIQMMQDYPDDLRTQEEWVEDLRAQDIAQNGETRRLKCRKITVGSSDDDDNRGQIGKGDGKGRGKGKNAKSRNLPPEKVGGDNWEKPRNEVGLELLAESVPSVGWSHPLHDDSRRCYVGYLPSPLDPAYLQALFDNIKGQTDWQQPVSNRQGRAIPRKTAWLVASGCSCEHAYGSYKVSPIQIFPPWLVELMQRTMPYCGIAHEEEWPNSCTVDFYEDGDKPMGWHAVDESLFQGRFRDISIISLALGATRTFQLRLNWQDEESGEKAGMTRLDLGNGDLMTMEGMVQKHYQHRVPRERNGNGASINIIWHWILKHKPYCCVRGR